MIQRKNAGSSGCCEKLQMGYLVAPLFLKLFKCWIRRHDHCHNLLQFSGKKLGILIELDKSERLKSKLRLRQSES